MAMLVFHVGNDYITSSSFFRPNIMVPFRLALRPNIIESFLTPAHPTFGSPVRDVQIWPVLSMQNLVAPTQQVALIWAKILQFNTELGRQLAFC
jgi:hypothetical protein